MPKSRHRPPTDVPAEARKFAEGLASNIPGSKPEEFRRAIYHYFNGRNWTIREQWERLANGELSVVDSKHYRTGESSGQ